MRVLQVLPGLGTDFEVPLGTRTVQFCAPLSGREYEILGSALASRPEVRLRIYDSALRTFNSLDFLVYFPAVRKLSIELWSLENIDGFKAIRELDEFTFGWTKTKSHSLAFLQRFADLKRLYLEGHTKDIEVIGGLSNLERLTLRSITLPDLRLLTSLRSLRHLEIKLGGTTNLAALAELNELRYLELWLIKGLADLSVIAEITSLEFLFLQALKNVTELPSLRRLQHLRGVYLETMKGLVDLQSIADAPSLESLTLIDMPIKPDALRTFVGHPSLQYFRAGFGSMARNAQAEALLGLPRGGTWPPGGSV